MKKTNLHLWLMGALLCGLSLSVTSCKDDDKDNLSPEEQEQQVQEQADIFWGVVDELAGINAITDDYQNKTFEPIIGSPSDENPQYRIVATNDMETAVSRFNQLIGEDKVDENTAEYTYQNDVVGTLTYRKSTDGKSWATVDVSIKQMPTLERIIYRSPKQADNNDSFKGTAYYRFGDIVTRMVTAKDGTTQYEEWICVRPAFGPEGKEKSHWVTVSPLPSDNVWTYTGSNKIDYALPTLLGDNTEQAQNFAEMLYAICYPDEWERNIINNPYKGITKKGITMFHDFDKSNLMYHSSFFWKRVQDGWTKEHDVFNYIFGFSNQTTFGEMLKDDGLNLLTKGYNWITTGIFATNSPKLHRHRFTTGQGVESNMHQGGKITAISKEVIKSKITLNVNKQYTIDHPYWVSNKFFDTDAPHYIIRHATGAELASDGKEDPKKPLAGVNEYWVYNVYYGINDLTVNPETFDANGEPYDPDKVSGFKNRSYYSQGDIVKDTNGNRWVCVQPSAYGDANLYKEQPYSYFISFEKRPIIGSGLSPFIPYTRKLAAQMLFSLEVLYQKYAMNINNKVSSSYEIAQNMRENLNVDLGELLVKRDTLHKFSAASKAESVPCSFVSTVYYDDDDNICVLRLIGDYTAEVNGKRDWSWRFYTNYTGSTTKMLLSHLSDINNIKKYNQDKWVTLPWYDIATGQTTKSKGPLTLAYSAKDLELEKLLYKRGSSSTTNMYREPIIVFTVKRVKDNGVKAKSFDDGLEFTEYKMMKDLDEDFGEDRSGITDGISGTYQKYQSTGFFLEEKNWQFGMANTTKAY